MKKRLFQIGIFLVVVVFSFSLYQLFSDYAKVNEEVRLRTAYYVKTGQALNIVQKEFLEGDKVESNNTDVAEITNEGVIQAKNPGTATITVTQKETIVENVNPQPNQNPNGNIQENPIPNISSTPTINVEEEKKSLEATKEFDVVVKEPVQGISLNVEQIVLFEGDHFQLEHFFLPPNAYNKNVTYQSNDNNIVSVSKTGLLSANQVGEASVDVITEEGAFKSTTKVIVKSKKGENSLFVKEDKIELYTNDTKEIHASITPDTDRNKEIRYQSSDTNIFTVDENGIITGKVQGTANLIVSFENQTRTIPITVLEKVVEQVQVSPKNISLKKGDSINLSVFITPEDALNKTVSFLSYDRNIIEVDEKGKVYAKNNGITTITVRADSMVSDTCTVEVVENTPSYIEPSSIEVEKETISLETGDIYQINARVLPESANNKTLSYSINDPKIATITQQGYLTALKEGNTVVLIKTSNGIEKKINVVVKQKNIPVTGLNINYNSISGKKGDIFSINASVLPENASNQNISFSSTNENVAKVSSSGIVTLKEEGNASIIVSSSNKEITREIPVQVSTVNSIQFNVSNMKINIGQTRDITVTTNPKNQKVTWESMNPQIAKVSQNGEVTGIKNGITTIRAYFTDNPSINAETQVQVNDNPITEIKITNTTDNIGLYEHLYLTKNEKKNIKVDFVAADTSQTTTDTFSYEILNTKEATLTNVKKSNNTISATITGVKKGTTSLVIRAGSKEKHLIITVQESGEQAYFLSRPVASNSDAILLESNGKYGLIDTSSKDYCTNLLSLLNGVGVKTLDFVILTIHQADHIGCFDRILNDYKIKNVYFKDYDGMEYYLGNDFIEARRAKIASWKQEIKNKKASYLTPNNNEIRLGNFNLKAYNIEDVYNTTNSKNSCMSTTCTEEPQSLVYLVSVNNKKMYLASDLNNPKTSSTNLVLNMAKKIGKVDLYKVANHGIEESNMLDAINVLQPQYAILTGSRTLFENGLSTTGIRNILKYTKERNGDFYYTYSNQTSRIVNATISSSKINITTTRSSVTDQTLSEENTKENEDTKSAKETQLTPTEEKKEETKPDTSTTPPKEETKPDSSTQKEETKPKMGKFSATLYEATAWATQTLNVRKSASGSSSKIGTVPTGGKMTILSAMDGKTKYIKMKYGKTTGYVYSDYIMINLPDVIPDMYYEITNADSSIFKSAGYSISGVTGKNLYGFKKKYNSKIGKETYYAPLLFPVAKQLQKAYDSAVKQGYNLKVYDSYRPYSVTKTIYNKFSALYNSNSKVRNKVNYDKNGVYWGPGWFLAQSASNHNRGIAVDIALTDKNGKDLKAQCAMHTLDTSALTKYNNTNAKKLRSIMTGVGFETLQSEWWHFEEQNYKASSPVTDIKIR